MEKLEARNCLFCGMGLPLILALPRYAIKREFDARFKCTILCTSSNGMDCSSSRRLKNATEMRAIKSRVNGAALHHVECFHSLRLSIFTFCSQLYCTTTTFTRSCRQPHDTPNCCGPDKMELWTCCARSGSLESIQLHGEKGERS